MATLIEGTIALLIVIGAVFLFVGSFGLAKLPDTMRRLHAPTKATTLGIGAMLMASMAYAAMRTGGWSAHELLISLFLFLTAPVSANMIAKTRIFRDKTLQAKLPATGTGPGWATLSPEAAPTGTSS